MCHSVKMWVITRAVFSWDGVTGVTVNCVSESHGFEGISHLWLTLIRRFNKEAMFQESIWQRSDIEYEDNLLGGQFFITHTQLWHVWPVNGIINVSFVGFSHLYFKGKQTNMGWRSKGWPAPLVEADKQQALSSAGQIDIWNSARREAGCCRSLTGCTISEIFGISLAIKKVNMMKTAIWTWTMADPDSAVLSHAKQTELNINTLSQ